MQKILPALLFLKSMKILGVDPGTAACGWGLIKKERGEIKAKKYGCLVTSPKTAAPERLWKIHQEFSKLLQKLKPEAIACEELFFFKNLKTAMRVAEARGIILLAAKEQKIPVFEYSPLQIKQAVSGYGRAEKGQVQKMVQVILNLPEIPRPDDAADALAAAICHSQTSQYK